MRDVDFIIAMIEAVAKKYDPKDAMDLPSAPLRNFMLGQYFKACVDNGGMDGFLRNPSGDFAQETIAAFEAIGDTKSRDVLVRACSVFPGGQAIKDQTEREAFVEEREEPVLGLWAKLDKAHWGHKRADALLRAYVVKNRDAFPPIQE
jgi:hypothetical protein